MWGAEVVIREPNDRHWKKFLWISNHIKVFYGMQMNGNFDYGGKNMPINPIIGWLKLHKQEALSIWFACLFVLDSCDCREINPFNNLWLKFGDFQFIFFRISICSNWGEDSFAIQACAGDNARVGMKRGKDGLIMQRTWKFCLSSLSKGAQLT